MKVAAILSFAAAVMASAVNLEERARCGGDNCARQVTGTRPGLTPIESRKADCTSFQTTTVIPEPTTTTVTVTVDADAPAKFKRANGAVAPRQATEVPTAVPAYASSCDTNTKYASACACWGITAGVTTAPQETVTVTSTVTEDYCEDL